MTVEYETVYIDTDATMAANSDHLVPSQKAVLTALGLKADASIITPQVQSNYTQTTSTAIDYIKNKPTVWRNGIKQPNYIEYQVNGNISGGTVTFNVTDDGTATGNALFNTIFLESASFWCNDITAQYQFGNVQLSSNKKQITVSVTKISASTATGLISLLGGTLAFLTGLTYVPAPNGTLVYLTIKGQ